jgi:DNA-binding NarL/FixJ family response regulator
VVAEASNSAQALRLTHQVIPDVVLMDLHMPTMDGTAATRLILQAHPATHIVVLTTFDDDEHLYSALAAGACGFLTKDAAPSQLLDAVRRAAHGEMPYSPHDRCPPRHRPTPSFRPMNKPAAGVEPPLGAASMVIGPGAFRRRPPKVAHRGAPDRGSRRC